MVVKSNILIVSEEFNYLHKHEQHVFIEYNPIRNKITSDINHDVFFLYKLVILLNFNIFCLLCSIHYQK